MAFRGSPGRLVSSRGVPPDLHVHYARLVAERVPSLALTTEDLVKSLYY